MKSTLYLKFIIIYIIFGFLSFFLVGTLTSQLILSRIETDTYSGLYQEANLIASDYLPDYFSQETSSTDSSAVRTQLDAMRVYSDASFWFVDAEGCLIAASHLDGTTVPTVIENFNPTEMGNERYLIGTYHGYFDEDVITVMAPVVQGFSTKGYILIHKPFQDIKVQRDHILWPIYISVAVIYIFSFIILLGFQFFVYRPLRKITDAATQYASGNLTYEIPVHTTDEMGYLSASLNFMASQIQDMEDYQKKFIANVSHDFRSPLTSIKGYVEAIADGTIPPELQGKYLNIISFETERLTDLTKDLLTLNEFDTKELLLDKTFFNIQEMIKKTAASFEGVCTGKKISIELLLLPDETVVYADHGKIQQVLYNLLDNAIKFSEHDSSVTVEVTKQNDKIFISVKDSGIGIPKQALTKIWDRFYKSDLSRGKDKKGTGLGLSIVKEIISAHDEHINVISTEGVGTEFIFSLSTK
ncbi:MAG: HAMP domain-containing sensor histidine kinase [Hespellia sp.]|nr:HAMP domain-containing sensor histidine kinase [Hespellia sp.]